jgi:uncharacterized protein (DUF2235 family)
MLAYWSCSLEGSAVRHLIVCCDGTWNRADQSNRGHPTPTNVRLLHNLLADEAADGERQIRRYFSGVGADGSALAKAFDGGTGRGLSRNIMNAYLWLARTYRAGDLISVFGFSRGAYTVRSLVGMLTSCGLARVPSSGTDAGGCTAWEIVGRIFERGYVLGKARTSSWADGIEFYNDFQPPADEACRVDLGRKIEFLGVWDTVGALGVPEGLGLLTVFDDESRYAFHDTHLNPGVRCARHAVAIDERRGPFSPSLWTDKNAEPADGDQVLQLWFPGCHSDIGGGYRETGLSDGALRWMLDEARGRSKLAFRPQADCIKGDPADILHDSCVGAYQLLASEPRCTPRVHEKSARVHRSAIARWLDPPFRQDPYRPSKELTVGESHEVEVFAHRPWGETGLYVREKTRMKVQASGEWIDRDETAGPDGVADPSFIGRIAYGFGELLGDAQQQLRHIPGHQRADLPLAKRVDEQDAHWMELILVVANGGIDFEGRPKQHQILVAGAGPRELVATGDGYLYAFANDAWGLYDNNRGSITLTVTRIV